MFIKKCSILFLFSNLVFFKVLIKNGVLIKNAENANKLYR